MLDCKAMATPMVSNLKLLQGTNLETMDITLYKNMVGSFMYLMNTRLDICFVMNTLIQYMEKPMQVHLVTEKHVLRYLKVTLDYGIRYVTNHEFGLYGYLDSHWAGSIPNRKSTSAYCFSLGFGMVSWSSKKQSYVELSTVEAKYVAACAACREAVWLQKLLSGLFGLKMEVTCIWCNNHSCMKLSKNLVFHDRSKHIEIKYHYIKDMVQRGEMRLQYVATEERLSMC
jgi:hypothetical protein